MACLLVCCIQIDSEAVIYFLFLFFFFKEAFGLESSDETVCGEIFVCRTAEL